MQQQRNKKIIITASIIVIILGIVLIVAKHIANQDQTAPSDDIALQNIHLPNGSDSTIAIPNLPQTTQGWIGANLSNLTPLGVCEIFSKMVSAL